MTAPSGDWIKVHRKLLDHPIMQHAGLCQLWMYCLLRANWKDAVWLMPGTTKSIIVPRGSFITGRALLHHALYGSNERQETHAPSPDTVWRWLKSLESLGCVTLTNLHNRCTRVTLCNFSTYQGGDEDTCTTDAQLPHSRCTTDAQLMHTIEDSKKGKNRKKVRTRTVGEKFDPLTLPIPPQLDSPEFQSAWSEWCVCRKAKGKPITEHAARQQFADFVAWGCPVAIQQIRESIRNDYTGVFPPKAGQHRNGPNNGSADIFAGLRASRERRLTNDG